MDNGDWLTETIYGKKPSILLAQFLGSRPQGEKDRLLPRFVRQRSIAIAVERRRLVRSPLEASLSAPMTDARSNFLTGRTQRVCDI